MTTKEARNQIYEWVKAQGILFEDKSQDELKKLLVQYGEIVNSEPKKVEFLKKKEEFHAPRSFG